MFCFSDSCPCEIILQAGSVLWVPVAKLHHGPANKSPNSQPALQGLHYAKCYGRPSPTYQLAFFLNSSFSAVAKQNKSRSLSLAARRTGPMHILLAQESTQWIWNNNIIFSLLFLVHKLFFTAVLIKKHVFMLMSYKFALIQNVSSRTKKSSCQSTRSYSELKRTCSCGLVISLD